MTSEATFICEQPIEEDLVKPCTAEMPRGGTSNTMIHLRGRRLASFYKFYTLQNTVWEIPCQQPCSKCGSFSCTWQGPNQPNLVLAYAEFGFDASLVSAPELAHEGVMLKNVTTFSISLCLRKNSLSMTDGVLSTTTLSVDHGQTFDRDDSQGHCTDSCWSSGADCWAPSTASADDIIFRGLLFPGNNYNRTFAANAFEFTICSPSRFLAEPLVGNNSVTQNYHKISGEEPWWTSSGQTREQGGPTFDQMVSLGFEQAISKIAAALTQSSLEQSTFLISGTVNRVQNVIEVQRVLLILPALLVALAGVFFIRAIVTNRKSGSFLWKSSVLALLYHGLERVDPDDSSYTTTSGMEKRADVSIHLAPSDSDGRLLLRRS
ncbi:hypothetical protein BDW71DRAFT_209420 [Aspergillus fruticulosus]